LSLSLGRPLLLEGAAGVGKTEVARVLSVVKATQLIRLQCYEGLDASQAIYEWNYQRQLLSIRAAAEDGESGKAVEARLFSEDYLLERPLLKSIRQAESPVLLIDEIDRADEEFEAYLLEVLSDFQITIPELGTVNAISKPVVILTANGTRDLSDALRRRCLYAHVGFAGRDAGPAARMAGFIGHLRDNGLRLGPAEAAVALHALTQIDASDPDAARSALKAVCSGCAEDVEQFDALFDSYWLNGGRVRTRAVPRQQGVAKPNVHSSRNQAGEAGGGAGEASAPDGGEGEAEHDGSGKLVATRVRNLYKKDLRDLVLPEDIAQAERVARQLGAALRDKRSRRYKAASKGRVGFGGGSRIGGSLSQFSRRYARRFVDGRSVVLVFSDGYDTDPPEVLSEALTRLKRRGCKVIWLNPLKGWAGYEPVARGMAAALPHLDAFCSANRLEDLAALERQWERL